MQFFQTLGLLVASVALFVGLLFGGNLPAQAASRSVTPEANSYEIGRAYHGQNPTSGESYNRSGEDLVDNTQNKLKSAADNVREKLNLDEPISPSTKEFASDVKDKVNDLLGDTKKMVPQERDSAYREKPGYYQ